MLDLVISAWLLALAITASLLVVVVVAQSIARRWRSTARAARAAAVDVAPRPTEAPQLASSGAHAA